MIDQSNKALGDVFVPKEVVSLHFAERLISGS